MICVLLACVALGFLGGWGVAVRSNLKVWGLVSIGLGGVCSIYFANKLLLEMEHRVLPRKAPKEFQQDNKKVNSGKTQKQTPTSLHAAIASMHSGLGGSIMPTIPKKVMSRSTSSGQTAMSR